MTHGADVRVRTQEQTGARSSVGWELGQLSQLWDNAGPCSRGFAGKCESHCKCRLPWEALSQRNRRGGLEADANRDPQLIPGWIPRGTPPAIPSQVSYVSRIKSRWHRDHNYQPGYVAGDWAPVARPSVFPYTLLSAVKTVLIDRRRSHERLEGPVSSFQLVYGYHWYHILWFVQETHLDQQLKMRCLRLLEKVLTNLMI